MNIQDDDPHKIPSLDHRSVLSNHGGGATISANNDDIGTSSATVGKDTKENMNEGILQMNEGISNNFGVAHMTYAQAGAGVSPAGKAPKFLVNCAKTHEKGGKTPKLLNNPRNENISSGNGPIRVPMLPK